MNIPTAGYQLKEKVAEMEQMLLAQHPRMPTLLAEIHGALQKQPENVTLMTEEEIAVIVNGLKIQTGVQFATSVVKTGKKSSGTSLLNKLKKISVDDF